MLVIDPLEPAATVAMVLGTLGVVGLRMLFARLAEAERARSLFAGLVTLRSSRR